MPDREKVIKGLTELKKYLPSTMWEPINNAIALLKEQEAKCLTKAELDDLNENQFVWIEERTGHL